MYNISYVQTLIKEGTGIKICERTSVKKDTRRSKNQVVLE